MSPVWLPVLPVVMVTSAVARVFCSVVVLMTELLPVGVNVPPDRLLLRLLPVEMVTFSGSSSSWPTAPSGAVRSTAPVKSSSLWLDTSAKPPLPLRGPPLALRAPAKPVYWSDQTMTPPPLPVAPASAFRVAPAATVVWAAVATACFTSLVAASPPPWRSPPSRMVPPAPVVPLASITAPAVIATELPVAMTVPPLPSALVAAKAPATVTAPPWSVAVSVDPLADNQMCPSLTVVPVARIVPPPLPARA
ncbi:hypothetical protein [Nitrospirillum viridazoti]|uniref:hypothetical protein n=1 Tax=Nitrospirillum viridazoti TaxID=3144925 RepID=UPI001FE3AD38|nr:hypothetical protein [Nitrospirillum amazonense]